MAALLFLLQIFLTTLSVLEARSENTISLGSSLVISATSENNQTRYWLSPSRNFAFGFYPLSNTQQYLLGIWLPKTPEKTLVWVAKRDDPPLPPESSLHLTHDGKLVLKISGGEEKPISNSSEPASFASLLDNGNFVLYNSDDQIIWESFDSPTDTILAGQRLETGHELFSSKSNSNYSGGRFRLKMQEDGNLVLYPKNTQDTEFNAYYASDTHNQEVGNGVTLNLDSMGSLFLLNSSGFLIKSMTEGKLPAGENKVYRSTLDSSGNFQLYSHSFEENGRSESTILWSAVTDPCSVKGICGFNSYCTLKDLEPICDCLPGFDFNNPEFKPDGCKRKIGITGDENCGNGIDKSKLTMTELENYWWANEGYELLSVKKEEECSKACLEDCYCSAAMLIEDGCLKLDLPLMYGRRDWGIKSKAFIKVDTGTKGTEIERERGWEGEREREKQRPREGEGKRERERPPFRDDEGINNKWFVIGLALAIFSVVLFICSAGFLVCFFVCGVERDGRTFPQSNLVSDNSLPKDDPEAL